MRIAFLEDADQARVAEAVVGVLKDRGALVTEHTHSHVRFEGLDSGSEYAFEKGGYVGVYQHAGEREVELRVRVDAPGPRRAFWWTTGASAATAVLFFILNPSGSLWVSVGTLLWAAFLGTLVVYLGTWRSSWRLESTLLDALVERFRADGEFARHVQKLEDRELARLEDEIEAEILDARLKGRRKATTLAAGGASTDAPPKERRGLRDRFRRAPTADAAPSVDEKRARLDALRAERERRRRERGEQ